MIPKSGNLGSSCVMTVPLMNPAVTKFQSDISSLFFIKYQ